VDLDLVRQQVSKAKEYYQVRAENVLLRHRLSVIPTEIPALRTGHDDPPGVLPSDLRLEITPTSSIPVTLAQAVEECEKVVIRTALDACGLHRENTAKALGVSVRTLHYKMSRYGIR